MGVIMATMSLLLSHGIGESVLISVVAVPPSWDGGNCPD